jgi:hypothetical protein
MHLSGAKDMARHGTAAMEGSIEDYGLCVEK